MESKPLVSIYRDGNTVAVGFTDLFSNLSDREKLETLNAAIELFMEKSGVIITSLEIQRTAQAGHRLVQ